jgi:hypothetical protein
VWDFQRVSKVRAGPPPTILLESSPSSHPRSQTALSPSKSMNNRWYLTRSVTKRRLSRNRGLAHTGDVLLNGGFGQRGSTTWTGGSSWTWKGNEECTEPRESLTAAETISRADRALASPSGIPNPTEPCSGVLCHRSGCRRLRIWFPSTPYIAGECYSHSAPINRRFCSLASLKPALDSILCPPKCAHRVAACGLVTGFAGK